jgi:hypothetical protein
MTKMHVLLTNALTELANTSSVVTIKMHVPQKLASTELARAPQRVATTVMHVPLIPAMQNLDARTLLSLVTTTMHAPRILATFTLDASTLQFLAAMEINVLSILASTETVSTPKKLAMTATNAQLKLAMLHPETANTLLLQSRTQIAVPSELAMQTRESSILQSTVKMETNVLSTIAILKRVANTLQNSCPSIVLLKPLDVLVMLSA